MLIIYFSFMHSAIDLIPLKVTKKFEKNYLREFQILKFVFSAVFYQSNIFHIPKPLKSTGDLFLQSLVIY